MSRKLGSKKGASSKESGSTKMAILPGGRLKKDKGVGGKCSSAALGNDKSHVAVVPKKATRGQEGVGYKLAGATSSYLGVHLETNSNRFIASVTIRGINAAGKTVHAGRFDNEVQAAVRRDDKVRELGLELPLNFSTKEAATAALQAEGVELPPLKPRIPNSSKFRGVHWNNVECRWRSSVKFQGKTVAVGYFQNEVEAAVRRDDKVRELGWPLPFNFPSKAKANAALRAAPPDKGMQPKPWPNKRIGPNLSSFKGVFWHCTSRRWTCRVIIGGKKMHVGNFKNEVEAAVRRDEKVRELGSDLPLNFPTKKAATAALKAALGDDNMESMLKRSKDRTKCKNSSAANSSSVDGVDRAGKKRGLGVDTSTCRRSRGLKFSSEEEANVALPAPLPCTPAVEAALAAMAKAAIEFEAEAEAEAELATAGTKRGRLHENGGSRNGASKRKKRS